MNLDHYTEMREVKCAAESDVESGPLFRIALAILVVLAFVVVMVYPPLDKADDIAFRAQQHVRR